MNCLPREQFVPRDYLSQLTCSIGLGVFNMPVALPCQHVFCKTCIEAWLSKNGSCPKCRESFNKESLKPQWIFEKIIKNAAVTCSNTGCKWSGPYSDLDAHIATECPETICFCTFGCGTQDKRSVIEVHEKSCELRSIECKYCNAKGQCKTITGHEESCFKNAKPCPKGCGQVLCAGVVEQHIKEECEKGEINCKFMKTAGCTFVGAKDKLQEHCASSKIEHLRMLAETIYRLQDQIEKLEKSKRKVEFEAVSKGSATPMITPKQDPGGGICWSNGNKRIAGSAKSGWSFFLTQKTLPSSFKAQVKVTELNAKDTNGWKICLGVFNSNQSAVGSWGKYKNGWGYISGNGSKMFTEAMMYGLPYGLNDVISIEFVNKTLTFYKNGVTQGPAYVNIDGSLYLAVALSDVGHSVEITDVTSYKI